MSKEGDKIECDCSGMNEHCFKCEGRGYYIKTSLPNIRRKHVKSTVNETNKGRFKTNPPNIQRKHVKSPANKTNKGRFNTIKTGDVIKKLKSPVDILFEANLLLLTKSEQVKKLTNFRPYSLYKTLESFKEKLRIIDFKNKPEEAQLLAIKLSIFEEAHRVAQEKEYKRVRIRKEENRKKKNRSVKMNSKKIKKARKKIMNEDAKVQIVAESKLHTTKTKQGTFADLPGAEKLLRKNK